MKTRNLALLFIFALAGCGTPLYESDYPLYRQYKYWEAGDNNWFETDDFSVLAYRKRSGETYSLSLTPHRKGLPSLADGYIPAAQKIAFNIMTAECGPQAFSILPSVTPPGGRVIDRYFYQNADLSLGVSFSCRTNSSLTTDTLAAEVQKWSLANRRWDKINGINAYVDTLPENNDGLNQTRIRLFGGTKDDNARLARRIMTDVCGIGNFKVLFRQASADITNNGRPPQIISDENVWVYGFTCKP